MLVQYGTHIDRVKENCGIRYVATDTAIFSFIGFGCQKVVHNLVADKLHKAGIRFVTLGEN